MDGTLDQNAILLSSNGNMHLWALYDNVEHKLYIATESAGNGYGFFQNDHFVFLSFTRPDSMVEAPWQKQGEVAAYNVYLADENDNDWVSWYLYGDTILSDSNFVAAASPVESGVLEGVIDLDGFLGYVPETVFVCAGSYETQDEGTLQWQVPPPQTLNGNIEADEFFVLIPEMLEVYESSVGQHIQWFKGLYPEVTAGRLILKFSSRFIKPINIEVYDVSGRLKFKRLVKAQPEVILNFNLPSGVYFIRVASKGNVAISRKIVVIR
jgi:hypothetical protein